MKNYSQMIVELSPKEDLPIIMLDMDGVVADYAGGVKKLVGMSIEDWKARAKKMANKKGQVPPDVSSNTLHRIIRDEGLDFWAKLAWTKDGKQLWNFLKKHDNVEILSAYKKKKNDPEKFSYRGKMLWLSSNMGIPKDKINLVMREDKKNYAKNSVSGAPNILIDDYIKNIKEFEAAGGKGIHHTSSRKTIAKLNKMGFV